MRTDRAESDREPHFQHPLEDDGLPLEELSAAYAELLNRGAEPYDNGNQEEPSIDPPPVEGPVSVVANSWDESPPADRGCELSPKSILEALLFVGNTTSGPLTSKQVASLMRGVRSQEIDDLIQELNAEYAAEQRPYRIVSRADGYAMQLRPEHASVRDCFYGRVKRTRLTQPAIDVLAIVAYRQPASREEVDQIRARPSGQVLAQLLRRGLLTVERVANEPKKVHYRTTERFLQLFQLKDLAELPQSQELP